MDIQGKLNSLDYIINKVSDWYVEAGGDLDSNDLSKLKITKLLFFISAISTSRENPGLLNTFDNFVAMPYGHVESDIQDNTDNSVHYSISKDGLLYKNGIVGFNSLINDGLEMEIDVAIEKLKTINFELVKYDPFELVDLSHRWQSWKTVFSLAKRNGRYSMKIPKEMIMVEPKIYI